MTGPRMVSTLLVGLFAAEIVIMLGIRRLTLLGDVMGTLLDASLLTLLLAPFLWWAVVRPERNRARKGARRAEDRIDHLNRVYAVFSGINQAIVRVREPDALFTEACRIAVDAGRFRMAWVGLVDEQTQRVRAVAHAGAEDGYLDKLQIDISPGPRGSGPVGTALREGRRIVCDDVEHDPRMIPWRDDALARGYRAIAAFPLAPNGKVIGSFNLYAGQRDFFDEKELGLLDELAADISFALEMAEAENARSRLTTAIEQSPASVVITDATGRIEYVNPAFARITGYSPEEVMGANPRILNSGKQPAELYADLWATIKAGRNWTGELVNRKKDGSLYNQELTIAPVREAGGATRFVAISLDATARKRAEETLRLQGAALTAAANAVMITERSGNIVWVNEAFHRLTGWSQEECLGKTPAILRSGRHDRTFYEELWRTILGGEVWQAEMTNRRKDGELYVEDQTITPVRDAQGEITHFVAIKIDIAERKRAEEDLQGAVRDKEALLKEVHHRVKNNLQVIISLLRLEWSRIDHAATRAVLKDMQNRIQSMAALHETLYRSGNFAEADLAAYLRQLSGQLVRSLTITPGQIDLRLDLTSISVDLEQAIPCGLMVNELLSNALKHGFPAGKRGVVSVELHRVETDKARLRVTDDGVGLAADFEARRAGSLGLQLVSDLAKQIQGTFIIGPGPRTVFEVTFTPRDPEVIGRIPAPRGWAS